MRFSRTAERKSLASAVLLALVLSLFSACGSDSDSDDGDESSGGTKQVTLAFSTKAASYSFALLGAVAEGAGFFEEEGLDVRVETTDGSSAAVQTLAAGRADIVTAVPADIMAVNQTGNADVKGFHTLTTGYNLYPVVPSDSDITTYGDLAGKRVAVVSLASGTIPGMKALAQAEGANPDEIEFLPVTPGAAMISALEAGDVDVLGYWDTLYTALEDQGIDYRKLEVADEANEPAFALVYAATSEWLQDNPETAAAFGRAAAKAYLFAMTNPEAAARMTLEQYPQLQSTGGSAEDSIATGAREISTRLETCQLVDDKFGYVTEDQVAGAIELQRVAGAVTSDLQPSDIWTDEYIDEINDFDRGEVEQLAETFEK
jgi:NitT/TauT family transport system substrate-binding protein